VVAAHVIELRRAEVIDDAAFVAVTRSLLAARPVPSDAERAPHLLVTEIDQRIESQIPSSVSGAATLGLAREEWLATTARLSWRNAALVMLSEVVNVSAAVLVLAETHVVTIMPAFTGGRPVQPTTLAHYLGALIGPLRSARHRLILAYASVNRGPLGAGLMSGDVLAADREELAERLGFDATIPNTLDAVSSIEDVVELLDAITAAVAPLARFIREIKNWIRTDPMSFVLDEGWTSIPEPSHPTLVYTEKLDTLLAGIEHVEDQLDHVRRRLRRVAYGPLGSAGDALIEAAADVAASVSRELATSTELFSTGLVVNRAYLGNRAGRGYTTAGDLATFLMTEEQVPPSAARRIAVLVLSRLKDASLEVSGITPDMIDSAALMTIGREIKVEMEALGRFLAPRRFIERRQVTGSPAPEMTRAWLSDERTSIADDSGWLEQAESRVDAAIQTLAASIEDAASEETEG
jgi:argininosuccinate lyase